MRQEFHNSIKRKLAERVAYICCNPLCRRLTIKPNPQNDSSVKSGKACHIYPASNSGPRHHERGDNVTDDYIKSFENGIWLCDICAREIDDNKEKYPAEKLIKWKKETENYVESLVTQDTRLRQLRVILLEILTAFRILNALPNNFDQTFETPGKIPLTRVLIEKEQILFENTFLEEAEILRKIYKELETVVYDSLKANFSKEYLDISQWKNSVVQVIMINLMRYSLESFNRYDVTEKDMVIKRKEELKNKPIKIIHNKFQID